MGVMILEEAGDFFRFDYPDKLLAYAGLSSLQQRAAKRNVKHVTVM